MTTTQLTRQSLTRCYQKYIVSGRVSCWLTGVLILVAICSYMAWNRDDATPGDVQIGGQRENDVDKSKDVDDDDKPDDDVAEAADALARDGLIEDKDAPENGRRHNVVQPKNDLSAYLEGNEGVGQADEYDDDRRGLAVGGRRNEKDRDGDRADVGEYDEEDRVAEADDEGNGVNAADAGNMQHGDRADDRMDQWRRAADDEHDDEERRVPAADDEDRSQDAAAGEEQRGDRMADDVNPDERDRARGDDDDVVNDGGGPNYHGDKEAGEDTNNDEVGKDADGVDDYADDVDKNKHEAGNAVKDENNGKSYDTCDDECQKFRRELASWPSNKPKAFIYYLIHRPAMRSLRKSIRALHRNFNRRFRYPVVVFVEPDLDNGDDRRRIADTVPADSESPPPSIYVQVVRFRIPDYVNSSMVPRMAGFGARRRTVGYRHMCRFHAGGVYDQPITQSPGLEYGWRLDDDSLIRRPINYDLFEVMRDGGYQYGYRQINEGWSPVDYALWDAVDRYLNATPSLTPTFYREWPKNAARYFNNFEVSDLRVWLSSQYRHYFDFVDRLGGIYYYKWGDAAIKTIAVTLFIPRNRTHKFTGIVYAHT